MKTSSEFEALFLGLGLIYAQVIEYSTTLAFILHMIVFVGAVESYRYLMNRRLRRFDK